MLMIGDPPTCAGWAVGLSIQYRCLHYINPYLVDLHVAFADDAFIVLCLMRGGINVTVVRRPVSSFLSCSTGCALCRVRLDGRLGTWANGRTGRPILSCSESATCGTWLTPGRLNYPASCEVFLRPFSQYIQDCKAWMYCFSLKAFLTSSR